MNNAIRNGGGDGLCLGFLSSATGRRLIWYSI
jgi:hypothetical protein